MSQYTEKGLPVVSQQLVESIFSRYANRQNGQIQTDWGMYLTEVQRRIIREQPHLREFVESQTGNYPIEMHKPILEVFVAIYGLLEQQAETNKLERQLK